MFDSPFVYLGFLEFTAPSLMAEVPVDFEVEIEGETGDAKAIEGVLGISQTNPSSSCTGTFFFLLLANENGSHKISQRQ